VRGDGRYGSIPISYYLRVALLKRLTKPSVDDTRLVKVDFIESFNYLLGLRVHTVAVKIRQGKSGSLKRSF